MRENEKKGPHARPPETPKKKEPWEKPKKRRKPNLEKGFFEGQLTLERLG